jgi:hypothetical protein
MPTPAPSETEQDEGGFDPFGEVSERDSRIGINPWDSPEEQKQKRDEHAEWQVKKAEEERLAAEAEQQKRAEREELRKTDPERAALYDKMDSIKFGKKLDESVPDAVFSMGTVEKLAGAAMDPNKANLGAAVFGAEPTVGPTGQPSRGPSLFDRAINEVQGEISDKAKSLASDVADVPGIGILAVNAAHQVDQGSEFLGGFSKAAGSMVGGVNEMGKDPIKTAQNFYAMNQNLSSIDPDNPWKQVNFLGDVGEGIAKPYEQASSEGRYAEMAGRATFDIGSLLLGGGEMSAMGKTSQAARAANVADDAARMASMADDAARASKAADMATDATRMADTAADLGRAKTVPGSGGGPVNPYGRTAPDVPGPNPYGPTAPAPGGGPVNPYGRTAPDPYGGTMPNLEGKPLIDPYGNTIPGPGPGPVNPYGRTMPPPPWEGPVNPYGRTMPDPSGGPANPYARTMPGPGAEMGNPYGRTIPDLPAPGPTLPPQPSISPMAQTIPPQPSVSPMAYTQPGISPMAYTQPGVSPMAHTMPPPPLPYAETMPVLPAPAPTMPGMGPVMHPSYSIPGMGGTGGNSILSTWDIIKSLF